MTAIRSATTRATVLGVALVLGSLSIAIASAEARRATATERPAILDAWHAANGLDDSPECRTAWVTRVSALRPRTAIVYANFTQRESRGCILGNGYAVLRRPARESTAWRVVFQSPDVPPCRLITARMARELGLGRVCDPKG